MALLWMDGFDTYNTTGDISTSLARSYTVSNSNSIAAVTGRYARTGVQFSPAKNGYSRLFKSITPTVGATHLFVGFNIKIIPGNMNTYINSDWGQATGVWIDSSTLKCGPNTVTGLNYNTWYHIEIRIPLTATSGSNKYELYLDGATVFSSSSLNFSFSSGLYFGAQFQWNYTSPYSVFDDFYVLDNTGSTNNARLSTLSYVPRIETLFPTSTTASDFTLTGAATAHEALDNVPVNTGQYISSTTAGHKARFGVGDLTNINNIKAVQFNSLASNTTNANNDWKFLMDNTEIGTTKTVTEVLTNSTPISSQIFETNPITSAAWTASNINSIEMGIVNK